LLNLIFMITIAYLVGSIPTAIIYGKIFRGIDIREHGSGNAGATNVFRVMGWKSGLIVLLIDITKGLIATLFIYKIAINSVPFEPVLIQIIAGLSAVFGHIWTIFAGFKGGKGVGTGAGMIIGIIPEAVLAALIIFIITVGLTRFVSLGSVLASITIPFYLFFKKIFFQGNISKTIMLFALFIPILIIYTHRSNIVRLLNGTENKIKLS
jgi:glycerol-3-phosphate acyltransferase PlsY